MAYATLETGYYDSAGEWQHINEPLPFGDDGFGGWGSWEALCSGLLKKRREVVETFGTLEFAGDFSHLELHSLWQRFTLVDPAAFINAEAAR